MRRDGDTAKASYDRGLSLFVDSDEDSCKLLNFRLATATNQKVGSSNPPGRTILAITYKQILQERSGVVAETVAGA
jgi:hypothetical protein